MSDQSFKNIIQKKGPMNSFAITKQKESSYTSPAKTNINEVNKGQIGHDFNYISINGRSYNESSCQYQSRPFVCPFGGACHTCPVRLQTKLHINQPDDLYEREADKIADKVLSITETQLIPSWARSQQQRIKTISLAHEATPVTQRQVVTDNKEEESENSQTPLFEEEQLLRQAKNESSGDDEGYEDEEESVQTKLSGNSDFRNRKMEQNSREVENPQNSRNKALLKEIKKIVPSEGAGDRLSAGVRAFFEPRLGYDFGNVRIHTNTSAGSASKRISALAFTMKNNIFFAPGQYSPETKNGRRLLAHELVHVLQQNKSVSKNSTPLQRKAEDYPPYLPENQSEFDSQAHLLQKSKLDAELERDFQFIVKKLDSRILFQGEEIDIIRILDRWGKERFTANPKKPYRGSEYLDKLFRLLLYKSKVKGIVAKRTLSYYSEIFNRFTFVKVVIAIRDRHSRDFKGESGTKDQSFGGFLWEEVKEGHIRDQIYAYFKGVGKGVYSAAKGTVDMVVTLATNPRKFFNDIKKLPGALKQLWMNKEDLWKKFANAPPEKQAEMIGEIVGQIEFILISKGMSKGVAQVAQAPGKLGTVARAAQTVTKLPQKALGSVIKGASTIVFKGVKFAAIGAVFAARGVYRVGKTILKGTWSVVEKAVGQLKTRMYFFFNEAEKVLRQIPEKFAKVYVRCSACQLTNTAKLGSRVRKSLHPRKGPPGKILSEGRIGDKIVIKSEIGYAPGRLGLEKTLPSNVKLSSKGWERAHSQGNITGAESAQGIRYAPSEVNQKFQKLGIEQWIADLNTQKAHGVKIFLTTETTTHPGTLRLKSITYRIDAIKPGGKAIRLQETSLEISNSTIKPKIVASVSEYGDIEQFLKPITIR